MVTPSLAAVPGHARPRHRQVVVSAGFEVDEGMAETVELCLGLGIATRYSCEGGDVLPGRAQAAEAYLMLATSSDAQRLVRLAHEHGSPLLREHLRPRRVTGRTRSLVEAAAAEAREARAAEGLDGARWTFAWTPWHGGPGGQVGCHFPATDLPLLVEALRRAAGPDAKAPPSGVR